MRRQGVANNSWNTRAPSSTHRRRYTPLHKNVPKAALADPRLYELLVLVEALRDGKARERKLAVKELSKRLDSVSFLVHPKDEVE